MIETFILKTSVELIQRKDFSPFDRTLLQPTHANPILMGEFIHQRTATPKKIERADGTKLSFAVWAEMGRSDVQVLRKIPTLFIGHYLADTLIFDAVAPPALGADLMVDTVTYDSKSVSGLKTHAGVVPVVGKVFQTAASNGNMLQFMQLLV